MRLPVPVDTAVLLAAGRGSRLSPWTDRVPKPLLVHRGRPTLDLVLDSLALAGVSRVVLVTHHLAEQFEPYAAQRTAATGQQIVRVHQDNLFGTAHALQCVMYARPELLVTPFVLSATDYLVPPPFYDDLLRFHAAHDAALTISLKALGEDGATRSSVRFAAASPDVDERAAPRDGTPPDAASTDALVDAGPEEIDARTARPGQSGGGGDAVDDDGSSDARSSGETDVPIDAASLAERDILEIVEKPAPGTAPSAIGANLCFVLPPEVLEHVIETGASPRGEREIQTTINAWLAAGGRARGLLQAAPAEWDPEESTRF